MITDEDFGALCGSILRDHSDTGFVLIMFDPAQPDGEVQHATNVKPHSCVRDALLQYLRVNGDSPNKRVE